MRKLFQSMETFAKRLVRRKEGPATGPRPKHLRNRLQRIEQLEQRTLLSISSGIAPLNIDAAWAEFPGINGTGVKVGVIATSSTERAEMAAIISDATEGVAKGATVYQETATTEAEFVTAVSDLQDDEVDVIVAAPGIYQQAWFEDGAAALAVQRVIAGADAADGTGTYDPIVVVTAAGDDGEAIHYQGAASGYNYPTDGYHNFGGSDYFVFDVEADGSTDIYLNWSSPWGTTGDEGDFNLELYTWDGSGWAFEDGSYLEQETTGGTPWETVSYSNPSSTSAQTVAVKVDFAWFTYYSYPSVTLEVLATGDVTTASNSHGGYATNNPLDKIFGPAAVTDSITVGTANWDALTTAAAYSSQGPSTVSSVARASLDGIAVDDVTTTAVGTGTAAAYTGGIVALMLDMNPYLDPADVQEHLVNTATDVGTAGYDNTSGAGLFNAYAAMMRLHPYSAPAMTAATDHGESQSDGITNTDVTNSSHGVVEFVGTLGSLGANTTVQLFVDGADISTFGYPGLGTTTSDGSGNYTITIDAAVLPAPLLAALEGPHAVAVEANGVRSPSLDILIDNDAPTVSEPDLGALFDTGYLDNDDITKLSDLDFTGTAGDATSNVWKVEVSSNLGGSSVDSDDDFYQVTLSGLAEDVHAISATVTDVAGNSTTSTALTVTIDQTAPQIPLASIVPTPGSAVPAPDLDVQLDFSEAVVGVDATDVVLAGAATALSPTVDPPVNLSGNTWLFSGTGLVGGDLWVTLAPDAGDIEDLAGNSLPESGPLPYTIQADYGDAPDTYPVLLANDGARHNPVGPYLGSARDVESDGVPTADADGDNDNAVPDDEEGVDFGPWHSGQQAMVVVYPSADAKLDAWIDFNGDGDWDDPGEQVFTSQDVLYNYGFGDVLHFDVPAIGSGSVAGITYARFRLSSTGGLSPNGAAADGEVEDYRGLLRDSSVAGTVYVNPAFDGTVYGEDPDGAGPAVAYGFDSAPDMWGGVSISIGGVGDTVSVAPGTYTLSPTIWADKDNITLTGSTGNPSDVVLDPAYAGIEVLADNVTIQDLTVTGTAGAGGHGIFANGVTGLTIDNVVLSSIISSGVSLTGRHQCDPDRRHVGREQRGGFGVDRRIADHHRRRFQ